METEFIKIIELNIIIYKNGNEYTLHKEVDFKNRPYKNRKNSFTIQTDIENEVLKFFFNNGITELESYVRNILNEKIELFFGVDKNNSVTLINTNKRHLELSKSITGIVSIYSSLFEVIDTYTEDTLFKKEEIKEEFIYGIFCIEKKSFNFLFNHPLSVLVCFDDFAKKELKKGSLLIKLKEIK